MHRICIGLVLLGFTACGEDEGSVDADQDGYSSDVDCDDADGTVHPNADERCDGIDNNCDGMADEWGAIDGTLYYADVDKDGFGDASQSIRSCTTVEGYTEDSADCDDTDASLNGDDQDGDGASSCDGDCDDFDAALNVLDEDGDGYSICAEDCDDTDPTRYPASENVQMRQTEMDEDGDGDIEFLMDEWIYRDKQEQITEYELQSYREGVLEQSLTRAYTYDAFGNVLTLKLDVIPAVGFPYVLSTVSTYNAQQQLVSSMSEVDEGSDGTIDLIFRNENIYNADGNILASFSYTDENADGAMDQISRTDFQYNFDGERTFQGTDTNNDGTYESVFEFRWLYNSAGKPFWLESKFDYDNDGVVDEKTLRVDTFGTAGYPDIREVYVYTCGECNTVRSRTTISTKRDANDNVIEESEWFDDKNDRIIDSKRTVRRVYDEYSNLLSQITEMDADADDRVDGTITFSASYTNGTYLESMTEIEDANSDGVANRIVEQESTFSWMCP